MPRAASGRPLPRAVLLAGVVALTIPAGFTANEGFVPIAHRVSLEGREASWTFALADADALYFEFEWAVTTLDDGIATLEVVLNDHVVGRVDAAARYATQRSRLLAGPETVRPGENRVRVRVAGPDAATFEMRLRVLNYFGISPRFPRAAVVSDAARRQHFARMPPGTLALRVAGIGAVSLIVVSAMLRAVGASSLAWQTVVALAPASLLWGAVAYSLWTPLHVWLSAGALASLVLLPCLLVGLGRWVVDHRGLALRLAASSTATVILLEVSLRMLNAAYPSAIFYTDAYSRYRGRPGAPFFDGRLNAGGFNDVEHDLAKPVGAYRIVALGDSVAFGVVPYRANYLTLLEADLRTRQPIEVVNLGVPGTEPRDYLAVLVDEGLKFQPDLVLVNFFVGNDFETSARRLYERSYAATALQFIWTMWGRGVPAMVRFDTEGAVYDDDAPTFAFERFLEVEVDRARIYGADGAALAPALDRVVAVLGEMRDLSRRIDADLLVAIIPSEVQVDAALQAQVVQAWHTEAGAFDFALPNRRLTEALNRAGIAHVDLLPAFERDGRQRRLYKPRDTHWNLAGNRLAASVLAAAVRARIGEHSR